MYKVLHFDKNIFYCSLLPFKKKLHKIHDTSNFNQYFISVSSYTVLMIKNKIEDFILHVIHAHVHLNKFHGFILTLFQF